MKPCRSSLLTRLVPAQKAGTESAEKLMFFYKSFRFSNRNS